MSDDFEERILEKLDLFEEIETVTYHPLSEAVDDYVDFALHPERRVFTGIEPIDDATRGLAPKELMIINGFAHNGKTVVVVEILLANEGHPCVFFTPDETRVAVLTKLTSAIYGVSAAEIERRLQQQDQQVVDMLNDVARRFANLAVFDDNVTLHQMDQAMESFVEKVGRPKYAIFDYADLLNHEGETIQKLDALKKWGKEWDIPFIVLHQSSKTAGAGGQKVTIESGTHGGHGQATIMIGVRRKINLLRHQVDVLEEKLENTQREDTAKRIREKIYEIEHDLIPRHEDTITVNLVKNKRPPMTLVDDLDYKLIRETGRLVDIYKDDPDEEPDMPLPAMFDEQHGKTAAQLLAERKKAAQ